MQGLGVGRGSQRHKAVLSLADNERNTFVFTAFGSYQQAERIPWRKPNGAKPSQGGSCRTRRCMCRQGAVQPLRDLCALIGGRRTVVRWPPKDGQPRMPVAEERRSWNYAR